LSGILLVVFLMKGNVFMEEIRWFTKDVARDRWNEPTLNFSEKAVSLNVAAFEYLKPAGRVRIGIDGNTVVIAKSENGELKMDAVNSGRSGRIQSKPLISWLKDEEKVIMKKYGGTYDQTKMMLVFPVERAGEGTV